jgi:hypothetical protein
MPKSIVPRSTPVESVVAVAARLTSVIALEREVAKYVMIII